MFISKVEWRFWLIHLCRTITFGHFAVFNQTAFMVSCLRSGIAHSSSRKGVQAMTVFGCFLRFPHKDFIASIRIFFAMKCHPIEDVRMYFWLETKMQGKQPPGNSLQNYLILVTKLSFGKTVVRFSLSRFESDDLYRIRPVLFSSGF